MHLLLLGATGHVGREVLALALAQEHQITALVEPPYDFTPHKNLTIASGGPIYQHSIERAFSSDPNPIDAVIVTIACDSSFAEYTTAPYFTRDSVRNVMEVMQEHNVSRLVVMSVLGAGSSWKETPWLIKTLFKYTKLSCILQDHNAMERMLEKEAGVGIEWTMLRPPILRPPILKDGEAKAVREFGETGDGIGTFASITKKSLAGVLMRAATEGKWKGEAVVVAN